MDTEVVGSREPGFSGKMSLLRMEPGRIPFLDVAAKKRHDEADAALFKSLTCHAVLLFSQYH